LKLYNLFVYGTLKRGKSNHKYLEGTRFVGEAKTLEDFCMFSTEHFPIVTWDEVCPIHGEVFRVDKETLEKIDALEGHLFTREEVPVVLLRSGTVKSFMYISYIERPQGILIREGIWR
jgi:gamma-glutamylcyclotransferase (GGCT)/AIG2-like uncharacterized protein YtfP